MFEKRLGEIAEKIRAGSVSTIAYETGIHYQTLYRISRGKKNITVTTLTTLDKYFFPDDYPSA